MHSARHNIKRVLNLHVSNETEPFGVARTDYRS